MKNWTAIAAMALICFAAHAQKEQVLFTVADDTVTKAEFEYIYRKNNAQVEDAYSDEKIREYLDLYTNFKLKVKAAKDQGIDTSATFLKEFEGYREQLIKPYLTDRTVTEELLNEAYERSMYEVRARHILIGVAPDAPPADTLKAYRTITMVRDSILGGADFGEMAMKFSTDPSAQDNQGDLGYFTALQMIYPFENAVYRQDTGEISQPVRTQFGYHLIEVLDKRTSRGERQVAHLMVRPEAGVSEAKGAGGRQKIDSLYEQLQQGASFEQLVRDFSDDPSTKAQGGKLPKFATHSRFLPAEFIEEAFRIRNIGDYTRPIETRYGWHIIKLLDTFNVRNREEMEEELRTKIARDARSELSEEAALAQIRQENKFKERQKHLKPAREQIDSTLLSGELVIDEENLPKNKWVVKMGKEKFYPSDFIRWLEENQEPNKYKYLPFAIDQYYSDWKDETVVDYQIRHLEENHAEYRNLLKEYKEGILLFDVTDKMVWSKAMTDTAGLEAFFERNQSDYTWQQRVEAEVYSPKNKAIATQVKEMLAEGIPPDSLTGLLNLEDPINLGYTYGKFEQGDNEVVDKVQWTKGVHETEEDGKHYIVRIQEVLPPQPKELKEIRGMVIADYQDFLEEQWIQELKQKYPVTINEKVLSKLF
ncbi:MAG: peptidylprolyl isomerase [Bacteroidia bacterium]